MRHTYKAVLCGDTAWALHRYHGALIRALVARRVEVVAAARPDGDAAAIEALGARFVPVELGVHGGGRTTAELFRLYRRERPDLVHHVSTQATLWGAFASRAADVPARVNGFTGPCPTRFLARALLRYGLKPPSLITFQNAADRAYFLAFALAELEQTIVIPGPGVDIDRYRPADAPQQGTPLRFLMFGRLCYARGVTDYLLACEAARHGGERAAFRLIGDIWPEEARPLDASWLAHEVAASGVDWLPYQDDIIRHIQGADVVVLPAKAPEGLARPLIEAMACGKAVITTDMPGFRDTVQAGVNGLLVRPGKPDELAEAMRALIHNPARAASMGAAGRAIAYARFSDRTVLAETFGIYQETGLDVGRAPVAGGEKPVVNTDPDTVLR